MKIDKKTWVIIAFAAAIILIDFVFMRQQKLFYFLLGVAVVIAVLPFVLSTIVEVGREREKEEMFLEFTRSLVENVKAGTPISKSIINLQNKDFGSLTPHIQKLGNQVALGIPVKQALDIFAKDIGNKVVSRAVTLISEAEQAGGMIDTILESVGKSVTEIEDTKKEQKAAVYNLVVRGYIIFVIFIVIMLVTEMKIIPMTAGLSGTGQMSLSGANVQTSPLSAEELSQPFLALLVVQGFFTGLVIGKLSEGSVKSGLRHSFIMMALAYLITTGARALVG
ncbi:MAG: type II secretion system F family protein [archaeon]